MAATRDHFTARVLAFLALVVGVNLWLDHHQGRQLANATVVSMAVAAATGGLGLIAKLLSKKEQATLFAKGLSVVRIVFWPPLLSVAWIAAIILALTLSSVTVVAEADGSWFKAAITPVAAAPGDAASAFFESRNGVVRMLMITNPFGRMMRVNVPGYVPGTIDVYPLLGRRLILGTDMRPSPSVLLRVPVGARELLGEGTRMVIRRQLSDRETVVAEAPTKKGRTAFLIGRRREVPVALRRDWQTELEADGVTRGNAATTAILATMLKEWKSPTLLELPLTLEPGMTLVAELRAPGGIVATATVTLGPEAFQDVALRSPEE